MIQQQIDQFSRSLQSIATQYSDPAIILQHIPVLRDYPLLQQNPDLIAYGLGGLVVLLFLKRILSKRRKAKEKNIALVMPKPYVGEADAPHTSDAAPASFERSAVEGGSDEPDEDPRIRALNERAVRSAPQNPAAPRALDQQRDDIAAVSLSTKPSLTPDEARVRVIVQSVLNECGNGLMIMSRVSLGALLEPGPEAVGPERAHAIAALADKYIDFGIFDRVGRLVVALEVSAAEDDLNPKEKSRAVVREALSRAGIGSVSLRFGDAPIAVRAKLQPYLSVTALAPSAQAPARPQVRRIRPKAMAAE